MEPKKVVCPKCGNENYQLLDTRWLLGFKAYICMRCNYGEQAHDDAQAIEIAPEITQVINDSGTHTCTYRSPDPRIAHATDNRQVKPL